jgi:S1-C subfamily serine protease
MKNLFSFTILIFCILRQASAQNNNDSVVALEKSLAGVVTVGIYKVQGASKILGMRGGDPEKISDVAYQKALDMSGASGSGSGFIIEKNGKLYVITNAHVIESASDEAGSIFVYTIDRQKYEVKIVGGDNFYDIAVLEFVQTPPKDKIAIMRFRQSEARIGEGVYAIGNPLGEYPYTVTNGIVSAKNRVRGGNTGKFGFIQTTATVIWGNSGGPLVDTRGEVLGINSQIAFTTSPTGEQIWQSQINFVLENQLSERLINDIINNNGRVRRAYLGIELSRRVRMVQTREGMGVVPVDSLPLLSGVVANSPCSRFLRDKIGATLLKVNDVSVKTIEESLGEFEKIKPNSELKLTFKYEGKIEDIVFKASTLEKQTLEEIAKHVLNKALADRISWDFSKVNLTFTTKGRETYGYKNTGFSKDNAPTIGNTYRVIAAGIVQNQRSKNLWKTAEIRDMGAVLKICGTNGYLDMVVLGTSGAEAETPQIIRINFSDEENMLKGVLWY